MHQFGTTETHLAKAKVACSTHGSMNPYARYKRKFTLEEVMNSPMVADPLRLYEICATSDGAAALILCSMDKARKYTSKLVLIAGVGLGSSLYGDTTCRLGFLSYPAKAEAPHLSESAQSSKMAYEQAGMGPEDMDFVELPDNSSWHYLTYLEVLGFCAPGEADRLLDEGETMIGGKLPVCPSGGLASFGEATTAQGFLQICELFWQLRGEAGERQIKSPKAGIAQTYGLMGNNACAILKV
jgi:acetyl-CoA acetyltransferase